MINKQLNISYFRECFTEQRLFNTLYKYFNEKKVTHFLQVM